MSLGEIDISIRKPIVVPPVWEVKTREKRNQKKSTNQILAIPCYSRAFLGVVNSEEDVLVLFGELITGVDVETGNRGISFITVLGEVSINGSETVLELGRDSISREHSLTGWQFVQAVMGRVRV